MRSALLQLLLLPVAQLLRLAALVPAATGIAAPDRPRARTPSSRASATAPASVSTVGTENGPQDRLVPSDTATASLAESLAGPVRARQRPRRHGEPRFFALQARRFAVFCTALCIYLDYQFAKRQARRLQQRLGLTDDQAERNRDVNRFWSRVHQRNALRLTGQICRLEGFWVKVGQYLSSRADIVPSEYLRELSGLQDSMPPRDFQDILRTVRDELTSAQLDAIAYIEPQPLSTASLAQVHRARLSQNDEQVVVKVQHRGVATLMTQDMDSLALIARILARFEPEFDYRPIVDEFAKEVSKEFDFRTEADNMNEVRTLLRQNNIQAIVPRSVPSLVTERVLVMEFCHGFPVRDLQLMEQNNVDRTLLLERICAAWAVQMHVGGVFNGDPHYGNILVSTDPTSQDASVPVLLDFGLTKRLDPHMKVAFARLMHASDEGDVDALLQSFDEMGLKMNRYDPFEDIAAMQRSFKETVPKSQVNEAQKRKSIEYQQRVEAMKQDEGLQDKQKLRNPVEAWPSELVFFGRVSNLLKGLCTYLEVKYPYLNTMANVARKTVRETVPAEDHAQTLIHPSSFVANDNHNDNDSLRKQLTSAVTHIHEQGHMLGLQLSVYRSGEEIASMAAGVLGSANPRPVTPSTLFNVFSVGKAYLTIGVLRLVQDGKIDLDKPVATYWPAFDKGDVTVRHVLTHQSGLSNAMPENETLDTMLDWEGMKRFIETAKAEHAAGEQTRYHYLSFAWLCGGLIEAVTQEPYDVFLDRIIGEATEGDGRLDLHTGGLSSDVDNDQLAVLSMHRNDDQVANRSTGSDASGERRREASESSGQVSDDGKHRRRLEKYRGREQLMNISVFNMRKVRDSKLPSANMHASASSLARVMDSITASEVPLSRETIRMAQQRQGRHTVDETSLLDDSSAYFGLGFQVHEFEYQGRRVLSFGHAGIGGSVVICIPDAELTVAFTTNQLAKDSAAKKTLLDIVFNHYELKAPDSVLR